MSYYNTALIKLRNAGYTFLKRDIPFDGTLLIEIMFTLNFMQKSFDELSLMLNVVTMDEDNTRNTMQCIYDCACWYGGRADVI